MDPEALASDEHGGGGEISRRHPPGPASSEIVSVVGIRKHYGGIQALDGVSLTLDGGQVHALVGANGAGKSTLVRILAGVEQPDEGKIVSGGEQLRLRTAEDATKAGLSFIHQELNLVPQFTGFQNMGVGYPGGSRSGWLKPSATQARARAVMARLDPSVPLDVEVRRLSASQRWMISLGRSIMREARMVAMDEPTAALSAAESERLFTVIRSLTGDGVAVLYISHRLEEVIDLSDTISVMRNGKLVASHDRGSVDRASLTTSIVGRQVEQDLSAVGSRPAEPATAAAEVLRLERLTRLPRVKEVTLSVRAGEVLGLAGLVGSGRTEIARLIFGADRIVSGTMTLKGRPYRPRSPFDAIGAGVALVPEERRAQGLIPDESIATNINLADPDRTRRWASLPLLSPAKARKRARQIAGRLQVKAASVDQRVSHLSGGNQQKVVLGRFVATNPDVLLLDEPTVGVDVGARHEIYLMISEFARAGMAIILISSDFDEFAICDRVAVIREGRVTAELQGDAITKEHLTTLCYTGGTG